MRPPDPLLPFRPRTLTGIPSVDLCVSGGDHLFLKCSLCASCRCQRLQPNESATCVGTGAVAALAKKTLQLRSEKSIAVEIPITRPNHCICSAAKILVQAFVTFGAGQVTARLTLRKQFLFGRALDLVLYEGYVGRPHHPACPCGRLFCWRHTTSGGGDSETF